MRNWDYHSHIGPRQRAASFDDVVVIVRRAYPAAVKEGSTIAWSFALVSPGEEDFIVATAWPVQGRTTDWWYRLRPA